MVIRDILLFDKNWEQLATRSAQWQSKRNNKNSYARWTNYNDKINQGKKIDLPDNRARHQKIHWKYPLELLAEQWSKLIQPDENSCNCQIRQHEEQTRNVIKRTHSGAYGLFELTNA